MESDGQIFLKIFSVKTNNLCFFLFRFCSERRYFANLAGFGGTTLEDGWSQIAGKVQKTNKFDENREIDKCKVCKNSETSSSLFVPEMYLGRLLTCCARKGLRRQVKLPRLDARFGWCSIHWIGPMVKESQRFSLKFCTHTNIHIYIYISIQYCLCRCNESLNFEGITVYIYYASTMYLLKNNCCMSSAYTKCIYL